MNKKCKKIFSSFK